jgi:hypothetical protein
MNNNEIIINAWPQIPSAAVEYIEGRSVDRDGANTAVINKIMEEYPGITFVSGNARMWAVNNLTAAISGMFDVPELNHAKWFWAAVGAWVLCSDLHDEVRAVRLARALYRIENIDEPAPYGFGCAVPSTWDWGKSRRT